MIPDPDAIDRHHLEHQFGAPAHRHRRQIHQSGAAGRAVPAGNQVPRRRVSAQALQASRLRARRAQRAEGLSRRRRGLAPAVRDHRIMHGFCGKTDCRHISAVLGERAGLRDPITLHNFYVPAGGDSPIPRSIRNSRTSSPSSTRCGPARRCIAPERPHDPGRRSQCRAARARRLEPQADARVVSHTPIECEKLDAAQNATAAGSTPCACVPEPAKLYTWWSYRSPDWHRGRPGRRLDHIWVAPALADRRHRHRVTKRFARLVAPLGPRAGDGDARSVHRGEAARPYHASATRHASGVETDAHVGNLACRLIEPRRQISRSLRRPRDSCPASDEQLRGNAQHRRRLERSRWRDAGSR